MICFYMYLRVFSVLFSISPKAMINGFSLQSGNLGAFPMIMSVKLLKMMLQCPSTFPFTVLVPFLRSFIRHWRLLLLAHWRLQRKMSLQLHQVNPNRSSISMVTLCTDQPISRSKTECAHCLILVFFLCC